LKMLIKVKRARQPYIPTRQLCRLVIATEILGVGVAVVVIGSGETRFYDAFKLTKWFGLECDDEDLFSNDEVNVKEVDPHRVLRYK